MPQKLVIVGSGGAGCEVIMVARRVALLSKAAGFKVLGFVDDRPEMRGSIVEGVEVIGSVESLLREQGGKGIHFHCAIGRNSIRRAISQRLETAGFYPATLIDPSAVVAESAMIAGGCYIAPLAFVGPQARLGKHVMVNVGVSIGHHSLTGDYTQFCPGARISGDVQIGDEAFIGSGAVVAPGVKLGARAVLSASSFANRDIADGAVGVGVPAKILAAIPKKP
jgi:sugar O-acyltransferase (sialic acid O-acetyltransferase NeuD family)